MANPTDNQMNAALAGIQTEFDADEAKGYRGARIDRYPNSAYSQESDPTTSPRAERHGTNLVEIDQFADPDNPRIDHIYGPEGLSDEEAEALTTQTFIKVVLADASAGTGQTTAVDEESQYDGNVSATIKATTDTITHHASNYRTFKLRNKTKDYDLATLATNLVDLTTSPVAMVVASSTRVSEGDEFEVVETVAGSGVAHTGVTLTIVNADPWRGP